MITIHSKKQKYIDKIDKRLWGDENFEEKINDLIILLKKTMGVGKGFILPLTHIIIVKNEKAVSEQYVRIYGFELKRPGFYSPKENTIFFSATYTNKSVIVHELTHVILTAWFNPRMPRDIQELICQRMEKVIS